MFLTVQAVSFIMIVLIMWILSLLLFAFPFEIRAAMYQLFRETGLLGENAIFIVYAIISLIAVQQIIKAMMGIPLNDDTEAADVDVLFPAPIRGHVFFAAKYLRSIPRRLTFFVYAFLALSPVIFFLSIEYAITSFSLFLFMFLIIILGEIGSLLTHGLYCLKKLVNQSRPQRRFYRFVFYLAVIIGTLLLLIPSVRLGNQIIPLPIYNLAFLLVALGTQGSFAPLFFPALPVVYLSLIVLFAIVYIIVRFLTNQVTVDLYEDLATVAQSHGVHIGLLSQLPIRFSRASTPFRTLLRKDIITGARNPGKAFYWIGMVVNFIFAGFFILLAATIRDFAPFPSDFRSFIPPLYTILLILLVPLLAITASDPFRGEYGSIHIIRLAPIAPLRVAFIKYLLLLVTPLLLGIPFSIYFAVLLGDPSLYLVALAILPHAIILSTAMGIGLGSRYPYATRTRSQTPVALMITFPVLSWVVITPVAIVELGFLQGGVLMMLLSALIVIPYTVGLTLILLSWAAHSYIRQE